MIKLKSEKGGVLVLTLMTTIVLSVLGLAMLPLTVMEYKSSHHFSDFEKAYYFAEAGIEEAIAELNHNWDYSGTSGKNLSDGQYDINISGTGNSRTIIATGKIGNIQRTIEANIEKPVSLVNLAELTDYAIFTQGDLSVEELGNIYSLGDEKGIIGVLGDLSFKSAENDGEAYLKVEGNVVIEQPHKAPNYPENFPPPPTELIDLSGFNMTNYIEWLKANFNDRITSFIASDGVNKYTFNGSGGHYDRILIFEDYTQELTLNGTINGLIIIKNTATLKISNKTVINGMIIFDGSDIDMTEFHITGSKVEIFGNLVCTNSSAQKGNWKLELYHDAEVLLENLGNYLPENFEGSTEDGLPINLINWKEIN